ncbi:MAG TPA: hypothetical protein VME67_01730 [Mycobacterium sp.]|nr:hypothetical protein [Mycobacterium sp.]HTX93658.1 hypothetical protein [Mycobacterium sp.]
MRAPKTQAAQALIAALDDELASASKATGRELVWSAQELDLIEMLGAAVDRRVELSEQYEQCRDRKDLGVRVKLAAELRLLEGSISRLHRQISTEVPQPMSLTSRKAQAAANARWTRERMKGANGG